MTPGGWHERKFVYWKVSRGLKCVRASATETCQSQWVERPQYLCLSVNIQTTSLEVALNKLRVIVYKIQILAGPLTSPIMLEFGMQSCFRVLTTKWMLKSFNSFYFAKYREGRFGVTLAACQYGGSKEFLLLQSWSCHCNFSVILVTDKKNYPSLSYLSK